MIEPHHGWISTLVPLDREQRASYEFYVVASDEDGRGALTSKARVKVDLLDVNDNPPKFLEPMIMGMSARCDLLMYCMVYRCLMCSQCRSCPAFLP